MTLGLLKKLFCDQRIEVKNFQFQEFVIAFILKCPKNRFSVGAVSVNDSACSLLFFKFTLLIPNLHFK